jgi:hypothetical protein
MDAQDGVAGIVLAPEHLAHLERADALVDDVGFGDRLGERVGVAFDRELEEDARVVELTALALPALERRRQLGALALDLLRPLVVVPELGAAYFLVENLEPSLGARNVKDAPEALRDGARAPPAGP